MSGDLVFATFSDRFFIAAVAVYVLAMVVHAAEYIRAGTVVVMGPAAVASQRSNPGPPRPAPSTRSAWVAWPSRSQRSGRCCTWPRSSCAG